MRRLIPFLLIIHFLLAGCGQTGCNQEYFQAISSINLPEDTEMIDCFDNLEWTVHAVFQLPAGNFDGFIRKNEFQPVTTSTAPDSYSFVLLPEVYRQFPDVGRLYSTTGTKDDNTSCYYLLDKKTGRLWAQINYPDWSGN